jgi:ribosomal protein S18 acetylase RimI-like enzyme
MVRWTYPARRMPEKLANVTVRRSSGGDDEFVHDLASRTFSAYSRDPRRAIRSILAERGAETLVAEVDSLRVGFVVLQYAQLARDFGPWVKPAAARLDAIAVCPDVHGRGVGRRLLEAAEETARRRSALSLSLATGESNTRARRLFDRAGFVEIARAQRYYAGGQAAILMHRTLIGERAR